MITITVESDKSKSYSSLPEALLATTAKDGLTIVMDKDDRISNNVDIYKINCEDRYTSAPQLRWNISGGIFSENIAASGGVVYCRRTSTIDGSMFQLNAATAGYGGAIYHEIYGFTITNSVFDQNSASIHGGAMYFRGNQEFKISGTVFSNNSAGSEGGAVYIDGNTGSANFSTSLWFDNHADNSYGGAISSHATANSLNITGNTFLQNSAKYGGAIYLDSKGETLNISGSTFDQNYAFEYGGAISACYDTEITGSRFTGNTAAKQGGVINFDCSGALTISESIFTGNTVARHFNDGSLNDKLGYGGVIYLASSIEDRDNVLISNSTFANNNGAYGGVVMNNTNYASAVTKVSGGNFTGNRAAHGGVFYSNSGSITISGGKYSNNHADFINASGKSEGYGGVLATGVRYANKKEVITVQADSENNRAVFSENTAYCGGVMYIRSWQTHSISQADFIKNTAQYGGAFYMTNESATFDDVKMSGNNAYRGGCFYFESNCQNIKIENSEFSGNSAANLGGVIWTKTGFSINDSVFSGNNCTTGAAIYAEGGNAQSTITKTMFSGNIGSNGIVCSNSADNDIMISGSTFQDNDGKAVFVYSGKITLSGVLFNGGKDRAIENRGNVIFSGSTLATAQDKVYNTGTIDFAGENLICASISGSGVFNVQSSIINFANCEEISIAGLTFSGNNTLNFNGKAVNFAEQDLSNVAITINTDSFNFASGDAITVATGIKSETVGQVNFTGINKDFFELVENEGTLTYQQKAATLDSTSFTGSATGNEAFNIVDKTISIGKIFFAADQVMDNVSTLISGGRIGQGVVGGVYSKDRKENEVETVSLSVTGGTITGDVFAGGYLYGTNDQNSSSQYTMNVGTVDMTLAGGTVSGKIQCGISAHRYGIASVGSVNLTVTGGEYKTVFGGGWAQTAGQSSVGQVNITVSGGTIKELYAGGNNGKQYVGELAAQSLTGSATITVSGGTITDLYLSGKYEPSRVTGNVTLTLNGNAEITNIYGYREDLTTDTNSKPGATEVIVLQDAAVGKIQNVDTLTIAENATLTGEFSGIGNIVFDIGNDGEVSTEWEALSGSNLSEIFAKTQITFNGETYDSLAAFAGTDFADIITKDDGKELLTIAKLAK